MDALVYQNDEAHRRPEKFVLYPAIGSGQETEKPIYWRLDLRRFPLQPQIHLKKSFKLKG